MARVALLVGEGFEDSEFEVPVRCLREAGHQVVVVGANQGEFLMGKHGEQRAEVEVAAGNACADDFDALVIPGGHGPGHLIRHSEVVGLVRGFMQTGKPVAAICHGPQLLIEANGVRGRTLTSWSSVRTDLINAGASWLDQSVVVDGNLITSRKPADLDDFCTAIVNRLRA